MTPGTATSALLPHPVAFEVNRPVALHPVDRQDPEGHLAAWGTRPRGGRELLDLLELSGLTGFGGAHVETATKWRAAVDAGPGGTVVANAAEGEPASAKDAALWLTRPHLILDGLAQAVETVGARDSVIWVHRSAAAVIEAILCALDERGAEHPEPRLIRAPDRYVAGQSSAVINALRGGAAVPRFVPTGKRSSGDGPPMLVHNTETLARVAAVSRIGPRGAEGALATVLAAGSRVVREIGSSTTFSSLVDPGTNRPSAILLGGYGGEWHNWAAVADLPVLSQHLDVGAGVIAVLPAGACGIAETARIATWMAAESARGCGPCRFGLPELALELTRLAEGGRTSRAAQAAMTIADLVDGRGACAHPDGVARMVRSSLHVFAADVAAHRRGRCLEAYGDPVFPLPGGALHGI